jgi:hypothetical protein
MPATASTARSRFTADEDKEYLDRVVACGEAFEDGIGREFRDRCDKWYRQYRQFSRVRSAWIPVGPQDRDAILFDAKRDWGANLHIPLSFRTIETVVPAAIAQRPRMLVLPAPRATGARNWEQTEANVHNVRVLIDHQQEQIDIDLPFQAVMRSGRIYGLGVGKVPWRKEYAPRRRAKKRHFAPGYRVGDLERVCTFDDPDFVDVDVSDFMWDPYGFDVESSGWVIHRMWLSLEQCLERLNGGQWASASAKALMKDGRAEDWLRGMGSRSRYDETWKSRMEASGFTSSNFTTRGEQVHEYWEWHDGTKVCGVLDRELYVLHGENATLGRKPFVVYRPTPLQKQMVGIGDLEPLEHLQRELDTMRSQSTDAITMALAAGFAYDSAAIDEEDLVWAPNKAIEVRNARPSDAIFPLPRPEIPSSAFRAMEMNRADIDAVAGVTEALDPSAGASAGTATEAFLVQAALSRRVQLASRRFEIEVVRKAARLFLDLNQRMILEERELLIPPDGMTPEQAAQAGQWRRFQIGPGGLMGDFEVRMEGGTMAARNIPQDRQDAQFFLGLSQNPFVEPKRALLRALELAGVDDPQGWLKSSEKPVPPVVLQKLGQMGVDPRIIKRAVEVAQQEDPQLPVDPQQQGPSREQMDGVMQA